MSTRKSTARNPNVQLPVSGKLLAKTPKQEDLSLQPLIEGAKKFIQSAESPGKFLNFINDALTWVHEHQCNKAGREVNEDPHFLLQRYIEHIIIPWYAGGKNVVDNIAEGFRELSSCFGWEGYQKELGRVLEALSYHLSNDGPIDGDEMPYIGFLFTISNSIADYESLKKISTAS